MKAREYRMLMLLNYAMNGAARTFILSSLDFFAPFCVSEGSRPAPVAFDIDKFSTPTAGGRFIRFPSDSILN